MTHDVISFRAVDVHTGMVRVRVRIRDRDRDRDRVNVVTC